MHNTKIKNYTSHTDLILDSIADGVFTVDRDWRITSFNQAAEKITGVTKDEAIGSTCRDVFHSNICDSNCLLKQSINKKSRSPIDPFTSSMLMKNKYR